MNRPASQPILGKVVKATRVLQSGPGARRGRALVLLLAAGVALIMTGYGIIMPVFARRLNELDAGVDALGLMTMGFALSQFLLAPFLGSLADRFGRRPLILTALGGFALANLAFLLAPTPGWLIGIRIFEGAVTAGLFPAALAVVADVFPENQRARWVGVVTGSYGAGFIFGPVLGGVLFETSGFVAPFIVSAALALTAFLVTAILVPETRPAAAHRGIRRHRGSAPERSSLGASLPRPLTVLASLLFLDFAVVFAFAFIEPVMVFFVYDQLQFTTIQYGLLVATYGLAMVLGQAVLGRSSDRFGRRSVIVLGFVLGTSIYFGISVIQGFGPLLLVATLAGLGAALIAPALSAFYLDITAEQHRSRILGLKASAAALGGIVGPMLVVLVNRWTSPQGIFTIAGLVMAAGAVLALLLLSERRGARAAAERSPGRTTDRAPARVAGLRGPLAGAQATRARAA